MPSVVKDKRMISINMKPSMIEKLDELAEKNGLARNSLIIVAISTYLQAQEMQRTAVDKLVETVSSKVYEHMAAEHGQEAQVYKTVKARKPRK